MSTLWSGTASQFVTYIERWSRNAQKVLPDSQRMWHWLAAQAFIAWNGQHGVNKERLQQYVDEVVTRHGRKKAERTIVSLKFIFIPLDHRSPSIGLKAGIVVKPVTTMRLATYDQMMHVRQRWSKPGTQWWEPKRWLFITLMWETGMSAIDAMQVQWSQIDLDQLVIGGRRQKSDTPFLVPFNKGGELHQLLLEKDDREGYLFPSFNINRDRQSKDLFVQLKPYFREVGLGERNGTHCFRRAFITRHVRAGTNPVLIARMVGHRGLSLITDYSKNTVEDLRSAVDDAETKLAGMAGHHKPQGVSYAGQAPSDRPKKTAVARRTVGSSGTPSPDIRQAESPRLVGDHPDGDRLSVPGGVRCHAAEPVEGTRVLPPDGRTLEASACAFTASVGLQPPVSGEAAWAAEVAAGADHRPAGP